MRTKGRFLLIVLLSTFLAPAAADDFRPNIVFILADDLAWSDLGCYGHPWHDTPHLDRLSREGMRFTRGYAPAPICSASRAAILTGKTPARLGFEFVTKDAPGSQKIDLPTPLAAPPFMLNLPLEEQTIPESLNHLGYKTAFFGKWHLNAHHQRYLGWSPTHGPSAQGFQVAEEDFGGHPYSWGKRTPVSITTEGVFPADSMIDRAMQFVAQKHTAPFFLMVSAFYVHTPVKTPCRWLVEKYESRIPADSPNREKRIVYGAFVETLDQCVGRILASLRKAGLEENTLVVFTSDNGGHPEFAANGPLRGSKWNLYEGGIRVPFLARWPGRIGPGSTCDEPVVGYDLLPTFISVAGGKATDVDGVDVSSVFRNPSCHLERDLIWHFPYYHPETGYAAAAEAIGIDDFAVSRTQPHSAILRGTDKLLLFYETERIELYDLAADIGEQHDLSASRAQTSQRLAVELRERLKTAGARLPTVRTK